MPNSITRLYTDDPERVFAHLRQTCRSAVVRWDGKKIGGTPWYLVTIVLDDAAAALGFGSWLSINSTREDLTAGFILISNATVVRKT